MLTDGTKEVKREGRAQKQTQLLN